LEKCHDCVWGSSYLASLGMFLCVLCTFLCFLPSISVFSLSISVFSLSISLFSPQISLFPRTFLCFAVNFSVFSVHHSVFPTSFSLVSVCISVSLSVCLSVSLSVACSRFCLFESYAFEGVWFQSRLVRVQLPISPLYPRDRVARNDAATSSAAPQPSALFRSHARGAGLVFTVDVFSSCLDNTRASCRQVMVSCLLSSHLSTRPAAMRPK